GCCHIIACRMGCSPCCW
uniref:Conotoxin SI.14 n=1 Tax=Conus textile TaxID=6494 RepID=M314_CONTE|nr:RecName: Full=Conotoxin SI.14 [Conus textile]